MGCAASTPIEEDHDPLLQSKKANAAIEKRLQMERQREKNEVKLLLLGAGESGKSTVLKQMKVLHQNGFTHQERQQYAQVIWADAIQSMRILILQARKMGIPLDSDQPNSKLSTFKQAILRAKVLDHIDTSVAGGSNFLNDYVLKYSERSEAKRRVQSTGRTGSVWDATEENNNNNDINNTNNNNENIHNDKLNQLQEINQGLNDNSIGPGVSAITIGSQTEVTRDLIATSISNLWKYDQGIQQCFLRANEFQLEGSASYYFENISNFADPNYICTNEDILKGRIKTTGITETNFNIGSSKFKVLDAGGQRSERRKWIHCFQDITAVLFVLAVSEYDQMLFEDERVNRMHEAIMLFDSLCNSKWFINTPFILFLNKIDLFENKIKRSPIKKYFPDYQGKLGDSNAGVKYFEDIFLRLNRTNKPIYVHRTCATDSQSMKFVLTAVTDMIVQSNLKNSGLI
ncbi:Guanine nucleotide-binding protein G(i) subunit alpha [Wickerhamomyces ciferrii]|uniref:Guanine nucleotide-binding protein G(I) subunit alpha n=1 Tax=Wickerhamomyces ciferrii (strain ATCC 14091 / BCRC 22168 / CBS 111 / JCM 3599 / NBRC 0793 / NRRL Y-1031 F-60-10) TaxID=1206466 RepID=K0KHV0_WICCF|nr:Guanine nucleotide-binding protein G(i) subunit alpha [Wickerhamomyces ciferrii]CCH44760.1 Guanine nucleotide-binding protein G(i) subunit alpha [Wickerhamomyces ciferrii]